MIFSVNLLRPGLKLLLVFSMLSVCSASSRYNRLSGLQRSLNGPAVPPVNQNYPPFMPYTNEAMQKPLSNSIQYDEEPEYTMTSNQYKRDGVRRCGLLLLKHIQKLCNGCVGRPKSSEESNRVKRGEIAVEIKLCNCHLLDFNPFVETESLTDLCCKKPCEDSQLSEFCCT